jgi:long-subunit acyl-CoA synthetase (AMP-forming)
VIEWNAAGFADDDDMHNNNKGLDPCSSIKIEDTEDQPVLSARERRHAKREKVKVKSGGKKGRVKEDKEDEEDSASLPSTSGTIYVA